MSRDLDDLQEAAEARFRERWHAGPSRTRWTDLPPQPGDPAPDAELPDAAGEPRALSRFWEDAPALLLFWRHNGCNCGIERASRLRSEMPDYEAAGANVVIVAQGDPTRNTVYQETHDLDVPILSDPQRRVYEAYGLLQGLPEQMFYDAPDAYYDPTKEVAEGFIASRRGTPSALVDDPWQLPGEFVVAPGGRLRLAYRYNYCEDYPDPRLLVHALRRAVGDL